MEFKEKLKERRAYEESEKAKANSSSEVKVVEGAASTKNQSKEAIDGNVNIQPENTDALEDQCDRSQMNGELESHIQNGDCATTAPNEDGKLSILSLEGQTEPNVTAVTNSEPALVNGECKAVDKVMLVEKETPKN